MAVFLYENYTENDYDPDPDPIRVHIGCDVYFLIRKCDVSCYGKKKKNFFCSFSCLISQVDISLFFFFLEGGRVLTKLKLK